MLASLKKVIFLKTNVLYMVDEYILFIRFHIGMD